jgi:exosortase H (IPTLxxWG-CTERM-specific)
MADSKDFAARLRERVSRSEFPAGARFAVTFAVLSAVLFGAYFFPYAERGGSETAFAGYLARYAALVGHALRLVEPHVSVTGNIVSGRFSMQIIKSCDGMEANILFCAATLAFPGPWLRKLVAAAGGLVALVGFNVLRLCSLYFIGVYFPAAFEFAHFDLWPLLVISFALVEFLLITRWINARGEGPSGGGASGGTADRVAA